MKTTHSHSIPDAARVAHRVRNLELPGRAGIEYASARDADRQVLGSAPAEFLDTTHFDTVRFPPPDWAQEAFAKASADGALAYTGYRGNRNVLDNVARNVSSLLGVAIDPARELILTPGTQAGLFGALASLIDAGDEVLLFDPDYLFSERILRFLGATVYPISLHEAGAIEPDTIEPNLDALEAVLNRTRPKLLVFSHPNNPTGAVYPPRTLQRIAELAVKFNFMVLVDQLYCRLVYDAAYTHLIGLPGMRERIITLLGPSKTESLSGYRLGVVVAPQWVVAGIENIQSITSLRAPAYAQHVLSHWLDVDKNWLANRMNDFRKLRDITQTIVSRAAWIKWAPQEGTAYAWLDVRALNLPDATVAQRILEKAGVLVSPGYQFGANGIGRLRLCYARDEHEWAAALERIIDVLNQLERETTAISESR
ncbi:MAG TPA: aminotransferase class I/II-fold pyridoxal phosphate-dependent enzyme [Steroidobacteraceae bacterium]|nr:aminotransferase class I/II-fold pyridoxal phosphate-dependent enzyme [Steroidobacteraceae bacterium]